MATPLNSNLFSNGIIASGKLCGHKYFSNNCFVCKNKRNVNEKICVFTASNFCDFLQTNIFQLFKNRSRGALADQKDIKFVFSMKNWFLGFLIPVT